MTKVLTKSLKVIGIVFLALPLILLMTACGGNTTFDGTWKIVSTTQGETTKDRTALENELTDKTKSLDEQFNLTISKDNKFTLLTPASTTAQTGTWLKDTNAQEETYKLTTIDNKVYTVIYVKTNQIKIQIDDENYYIMNK